MGSFGADRSIGPGLLEGIPGRDAEAGSVDGGGGHCHGSVFQPEARSGKGDACCHGQSLSPALYHRLRASVHLHSEKRRLDPPCLSLHGTKHIICIEKSSSFLEILPSSNSSNALLISFINFGKQLYALLFSPKDLLNYC
jgi:hypothetical protein